MASSAGLLLAASLIAGGLGAGGFVMLVVVDASDSFGPIPSETTGAAVTFSMAALLAAFAGGILYRSHSRRAGARAVAVIAGFAVAFGGGELLCRLVVPAWPARALHGVPPEQWAAATGATARTVPMNSWGQRDRERALRPPAGVRRVAFIGDSFLEEGAVVPVSLQVERILARPDVEVCNLGVSASGPDEYYERLRGVALPLGASHCFLFLFAGNDFVSPARTLPSFGGIAAVEPRPSFLGGIGFAGWNHLLTNWRRPVVEAWMTGSPLSRDEQARHEALRQASDGQIRQMLLQASGFKTPARERLAFRLDRDDAVKVFTMLRDPDDGKFRSYYLTAALIAASDEDWKWEPNSDDIAWHWTERAARLCRSRNVRLTVAIIPEAFQVDDRMREQWLPLADLRRCTAPCREAAESFVRRCRAHALDVIDLHEEFQGTRGTYLNLDGHWSDAGVERAAHVLARNVAAADVPTGAAPYGR